jgi:hypothetical protein
MAEAAWKDGILWNHGKLKIDKQGKIIIIKATSTYTNGGSLIIFNFNLDYS